MPFELACKSKSAKVVEIALDSIQVKDFWKAIKPHVYIVMKIKQFLLILKKLVAHGYLNESSQMSPASSITKQQLIQRITKTICQCFEGPSVDENVQLQIIKVELDFIF